MKYIYILALLLTLSLPAYAAEGFSSVIDDLPLMPGMVEKTDEAVMFDKPNGRIVETSAAVAAPAAEVKQFYHDALPPLGWRPVGSSFMRENETLKLTFDEKSGVTTVHFNLTPKE